jgi:hypothetical protein
MLDGWPGFFLQENTCRRNSREPRLLESIRQPNSGDGQQEPDDNANGDIACRRDPPTFFQHLGGLPSEARERCVASKEAHSNRDAPIGRNHHSVQRQLSDQAEQKTAGEIDRHRAPGKG